MNQDEKKIFDVVIAGGGSAGWMAAAFLSEVFKLENSQKYTVTLVESETIAPIGVGEATIQSMRGFLAACGINEGEFLVATDATFKHGILFKEWLHKQGEDELPHQYFHPFEGPMTLAPEPLVSHWLNAKLSGLNSERYDRCSGVQGALAAAGRCPKTWQSSAYEAPINYGYHLDATKFATFLKKISLQKGVKHLLADINGVHLSEKGNISHLDLKSGQHLYGDLFLDCTGFSGLLMKSLDSEFIDYSKYLFCDRAVTIRLPHKSSDYEPRPYTTATARESGWTFEIDLQGRTGFGYIYSSKHCDSATAEEALRRFYPNIVPEQKANHLKMNVGRLKKSWNRNCVAVGLSSGFLEPLESTGLYFVEMELRLLVDYWDPLSKSTACQEQFNDAFNSKFDEAMEFIVLHYVLTKREDSSFWRDVQSQTAELPALKHKLAMWEHKPPTDGDFKNETVLFRAPNYSTVLYGMDWLPEETPVSISHIPPQESLEHFVKLRKLQKMAIEGSPTHSEYLKKYTASFR
ncbi:Tryptophan halogenase [Marinobacter sp. DSM 26671]|uniref:tryptophan halogenase family protein n=1 Tax=Marinobacter sp. DSM 26671 TaxID=1761793 RepID=UPI0008E140CF|nr:tryptophan halogenase family protein [Marinobacter sp. DSM 26671]SFE95616.1 Tryptophan halogenase [Marinobacter sp. DSM 26671]